MILHLFDMAGVASLTAKLCNQHKMPSICCYRPKDDPYGISSYYKNQPISNHPFKMILEILFKLLYYRPRIVVVHYHQILLWLRLITTICRIKCQYIMQYHGSDIRGSSPPWYSKLLAHRFIFVTADIIDAKLRNGTLLENPVDRDHFHRRGLPPNANRALFFRTKPYDCLDDATYFAALYGLKLATIDLLMGGHFPYQELPTIFNNHHYFFDMKGLGRMLSKSALEALSCGCIVVQEDGNWIYPYQINNDAKIRRIVTYYEQITKVDCR